MVYYYYAAANYTHQPHRKQPEPLIIFLWQVAKIGHFFCLAGTDFMSYNVLKLFVSQSVCNISHVLDNDLMSPDSRDMVNLLPSTPYSLTSRYTPTNYHTPHLYSYVYSYYLKESKRKLIFLPMKCFALILKDTKLNSKIITVIGYNYQTQ